MRFVSDAALLVYDAQQAQQRSPAAVARAVACQRRRPRVAAPQARKQRDRQRAEAMAAEAAATAEASPRSPAGSERSGGGGAVSANVRRRLEAAAIRRPAPLGPDALRRRGGSPRDAVPRFFYCLGGGWSPTLADDAGSAILLCAPARVLLLLSVARAKRVAMRFTRRAVPARGEALGARSAGQV
jgi:hypothetical protein